MKTFLVRSGAIVALAASTLGLSGQAVSAATSTLPPTATFAATQEDPRGIKTTIIKTLRAGGPLLAEFLKRFDAEAAEWVKKNAAKLADYLEGSDWSYDAIKNYLIANGCPERPAHLIAKILSEIAGQR